MQNNTPASNSKTPSGRNGGLGTGTPEGIPPVSPVSSHSPASPAPVAGNEGAANERQVGGDHYRRYGELQHWDVVAHFNLDYFQGQITKYVMRWKNKGGIKDLEKARHFLDKYLELVRAGKLQDMQKEDD